MCSSDLKLSQKEGFAHEFVHQVTKNNLDADEMAYEIHQVDERFPGPMLVMDPGGGGQFVEASLKKRRLELYGDNKAVTPIFEAQSPESDGKNILYWFSRGTLAIRETLGSMSGDDVLVNNAHNTLKNYIEKVKVLVPYSEEMSVYFTRILDGNAQQRNLQRSKLTELELQYYNIELAMMQLQGVQLKTDKATGKPYLTGRGQFVFTSTKKKDSAYSFLYAIFGVFLYNEMQREDMAGDGDSLGTVLKQDLDVFSADWSLKDENEEVESYGEGIFSFKDV